MPRINDDDERKWRYNHYHFHDRLDDGRKGIIGSGPPDEGRSTVTPAGHMSALCDPRCIVATGLTELYGAVHHKS